jgi:formate hydrogenlyase subunit 3/multisubunit Na+/H+ antiporter MnhD subunit
VEAWLLPLPVLLPLAGALLSFTLPRWAGAIGRLTALANLGLVLTLLPRVLERGSVTIAVGGWAPPLGISLRIDGLSAAMMLMAAVVATGISIYAAAYFSGRAARGYWPLWLIMLTALNAMFLSADLFNLYVTLELLGISAVALTALEGERDALLAAMRYLFATLCGSLAYLLGVALIYHAAGTVDIALVGARLGEAGATGASRGALALMTAGLLVKCALFPLHFWLPPAHGGAPAPVSAALSALVVKGAFFILLRLWLEVFSPLAPMLFMPLAVLGGLAVLWGSLQALVQQRMKMLIAYSTVAQLGYLFLALPLTLAAPRAWGAIVLLMFAHALAKAAMFLAAGNLLSLAGHDRIADLGTMVRRVPLTVTAILLAGVSLMGLPPSGGFNAKWMLLQEALSQGYWGIVLVLLLGGLLAAAYLFRLVEQFFVSGHDTTPGRAMPLRRELPALLLAALALGMGLLTMPWLRLVAAGGPLTAAGSGL